jgi:hypothetical protein
VCNTNKVLKKRVKIIFLSAQVQDDFHVIVCIEFKKIANKKIITGKFFKLDLLFLLQF